MQNGWRRWGRDTCQEHRLEAGRCDEEVAKLERLGWRCGFTPAKRNTLKAKTDSSLATSAGTFIAAPKHWGLEWVWPARGWQSKELQDQGRLTMAWVPIVGGLTVFSVYFYHTEEWTERNQQILEAASREIRRCPGLWILVGLRLLGNMPHPRYCQESWSGQRYPRSDMERRSDALITLCWPARCGKCECWKNQGSVPTTQYR